MEDLGRGGWKKSGKERKWETHPEFGHNVGQKSVLLTLITLECFSFLVVFKKGMFK
jgi:hypothetical protein